MPEYTFGIGRTGYFDHKDVTVTADTEEEAKEKAIQAAYNIHYDSQYDAEYFVDGEEPGYLTEAALEELAKKAFADKKLATRFVGHSHDIIRNLANKALEA